jgi:hypothetical protein
MEASSKGMASTGCPDAGENVYDNKWDLLELKINPGSL